MTEKWEMVQLATENHNFHMHQSRFVERTGNTVSVVQDNFPLGVAVPDATIADQVANNQLGTCTVQQWRSGHCVSPPVVMDIPFTQLGEFVYHCHILELVDLLARDRSNPPLAAGEIVTTGTLTRALPVSPGETWTTDLMGVGLAGIGVRFA